ncbi:MAG TPA: hypothetical protein VM695_03690 [Phycisphaerae bacterium]|nr:hypothetical protein [Phycisphaerae bacterium]
MPIQFECQHCHKQVTAPDAAAGKRGKCPFCGKSNEVPAPPPAEDDDLIPLAPIDDEEERRERAARRALYEQEQDLLRETGGPISVPLSQRENLTPADLHHFVVNYCLDMADGKLDRADLHAQELKKFAETGRQAVTDFASGQVVEDVLHHIPQPVLTAFLKRLAERFE